MAREDESQSVQGKTTLKGGKMSCSIGARSKAHLNEYSDYLREICGLKPDSITQMVNFGRRFLQYAAFKGISPLSGITIDIVHSFLVEQSEGCARETALGRCWKLRRFLSFLQYRGVTRSDLSAVIIRPRTFRRESCPSYLTRAEVEHVISRIDRRTSEGKHDYAVIMLLATYGLRGAEVVGLRLDDIEWRARRIHLRNRKGGNNLVHPLTPEVAGALLAYLKASRPKTSDRHVFVSSKPPHTGLRRTEAIRRIVKKRVALAGFNKRRIGAHVFRHSCAQRLLEVDHDLKTIADFLGHRDLDTTRRYLRIDIEHLRAVAINNGENLP